jgi:hypothetical protein
MRSFIVYTFYQILLGKIKSKRMGKDGHAACIGEMRTAYKILVDNLKGRPLWRHKWEDIVWILKQ